MADCACRKRPDGSTTWERDCPEHGEEAIRSRLLPVGERVRCVSHPELTGHIQCYEWTKPGVLSPIPYNVAWDDGGRAFELRGWLHIYATVDQVERETVSEPA